MASTVKLFVLVEKVGTFSTVATTSLSIVLLPRASPTPTETPVAEVEPEMFAEAAKPKASICESSVAAMMTFPFAETLRVFVGELFSIAARTSLSIVL